MKNQINQTQTQTPFDRMRFTREDVMRNTFYQMPKFLFSGEFRKLSNDARTLYSILRDRHDLSTKNNWINTNGEVYILYSRENMCEILGISEKPVIKAMNDLKKYGLVEEERKGQGKPNWIFLLNVKFPENPEFTMKSKDYANQPRELTCEDWADPYFKNEATTLDFTKNRQIASSENVNSTALKLANLQPNDTDFNDTDFNQSINQSEPKPQIQKNQKEIDGLIEPKPSQLADEKNKPDTNYQPTIISRAIEEYEENKEMIKANIEYDYLVKHSGHEADMVEEIMELMVENISSSKETIRIGGEEKPRAVVVSRLKKLDVGHIEYVLECLKANTTKVHNIRAYLLTSLYNAFTSVTNYYRQQVNFDMHEGVMARG